MFSFIILQDIYFTCLTLSTGIPIESLYIYINTTAHTLITMGNHAFLYFKNKRKKKFLHVSNKIFELKTCSFSVQCRQMKKLCVFVNHKIKSVELPSQTTIFAHATTSKRE